jgi:hypothetical protein
LIMSKYNEERVTFVKFVKALDTIYRDETRIAKAAPSRTFRKVECPITF